MDKYWERLAYARRELSTCSSEPLQFVGAIQTWGFYLACELGGERIIAASQNCVELLGLSAKQILGKPLSEFFTLSEGGAINVAAGLEHSRSHGLRLKARNTGHDVQAHFASNAHHVCVDLEFGAAGLRPDPSQFVEHLRTLVFHADAEDHPIRMLDRAAQQIRALTEFDRVMVYRFEQSCDGNVVAESVAPGVDSFLGLWYPASDIPAQARHLYFQSRYRVIGDIEALPVPIFTRPGLGRSELDLSCSSLRAVSPFHIEYLKNMGVRSSFSVPLKVNGRLWGLIACHQLKEPRHLPRELRSSCELAAQVLSGRLSDHINERRLRTRNRILSLSQSILAHVSEGQTPIEAFHDIGPELLEMTHSAGAIVRFAGGVVAIGQTPEVAYVDAILLKLKANDSLALWHSDSVARDLNLPVHPDAIGALAVPFSFAFDELIIWFRPESVREVRWGGKPSAKESLPDVLSPRASFRAWSETIRGCSREWDESSQEAAQHLLFMFVKGIFQKAAELSRANFELEKLTRAKDEFIGMISHELRTPLGVMIGWIDILRDEGSSDPRVIQALEIIDRNAKLQITLINDLLDVSRIIAGKMRLNPQDHVSIATLIQDVAKDLGHSAAAKGLRLSVKTPEDIAASVDADRMRQVIWNLLANAIKFTAKNGEIEISLERVSSSYQIRVADNGIGIERTQLKRIFDRFAQSNEGDASMGGLGLGLSIVKALVELHGGQITALSAGKNLGSTFVASFPIFTLKHSEPELTPKSADGHGGGELTGVRILLAEDQADAGLALDYYLRKAGAQTTLVKDGASALKAVSEGKYDALLSDIGMPVMDGIELIRRVRKLEQERRAPLLPAVALTAYATPKDRTRCLQAGFQNHIAKPVDRDELLAVIRSVLTKDRA